MLIFTEIKKFVGYKFVQDSAYTFISFGILAGSGILANILIGNTYGADGLGVFNQSLALYMIFSLVTVFGLNTAVVKYISQYNQNLEIQKEIFSTAILLVTGISFVFAFILWFLAHRFPSLYFNMNVTKSTSIIVLSLPFLSQNRIFMALLNAQRNMKVYAIVQSIRWVFVISFIIISILLHKSVYFLAYSFLFSELAILLYFIFFYSKFISFNFRMSPWYKVNLVFGFKSVFVGFLSETNNKVDIFLISFFLSNYYVGVYSFAADIAKGFLSIGSVIELNINPIISDLWMKRDIPALKKYTLRVSKIMVLVITPIFSIAACLYPVFIKYFMSDKAYLESIPIFYVLLPGMFLLAVYYFAGAYLSMANFLNEIMICIAIVLFYNIISCIILINLFGIFGAAISTSTTYLLTILVINYFIKKKMGFSLINLNSK